MTWETPGLRGLLAAWGVPADDPHDWLSSPHVHPGVSDVPELCRDLAAAGISRGLTQLLLNFQHGTCALVGQHVRDRQRTWQRPTRSAAAAGSLAEVAAARGGDDPQSFQPGGQQADRAV